MNGSFFIQRGYRSVGTCQSSLISPPRDLNRRNAKRCMHEDVSRLCCGSTSSVWYLRKLSNHVLQCATVVTFRRSSVAFQLGQSRTSHVAYARRTSGWSRCGCVVQEQLTRCHSDINAPTSHLKKSPLEHQQHTRSTSAVSCVYLAIADEKAIVFTDTFPRGHRRRCYPADPKPSARMRYIPIPSAYTVRRSKPLEEGPGGICALYFGVGALGARH